MSDQSPNRPMDRLAAGATRGSEDIAPGVSALLRDDRVGVIQIDRPPANYFDRDVVAALADAAVSLSGAGARALLLCSTGRVFCAGADFGSTQELDPMSLYLEGVRLFRRDVPMVVAVQGAAVGGGAGLALAGDFRVGSPQTRFAVNFAQIGIHHGFGISVTLPRVVGDQAAWDLLGTARRVGGEEAFRLRLVDRLVQPERVLDESLELARSIAALAPLAVRSMMRTMRGDLADQVAEAVRHESAEQIDLFRTDDFAEGVAAVAARRPGVFQGR